MDTSALDEDLDDLDGILDNEEQEGEGEEEEEDDEEEEVDQLDEDDDTSKYLSLWKYKRFNFL